MDETFPEEPIEILKKAGSVSVMTGAGISAESGIRTFRGKDGLWDEFDPDEVATPQAFERSPLKVWKWHDELLGTISDCKPHAAHSVLASMERHYEEFVVVTQNIDNFHQDAGSKNVIELHGNAWRVKCIEEGKVWLDRKTPKDELPPHCSCGSLIRPDVVWFNEPLPLEALQRSQAAMLQCDVLLVIGTSAVIQPAASLPFIAFDNGTPILEFNLEPTPHTGICTYSFFGKAGETLPMVWDQVKMK